MPVIDVDDVLAGAVRHRIVGCALAAVRAVSPMSPLKSALEPAARTAVATHLRAVMELALLRDALTDLSWLVFKGPVLAGYAYPRPDMRTYGDLDVLVAPAQLGAAVERLEAAGWLLMDRNWNLFVRDLPGEVHLRTPLGGMLDLHWHVQNDRQSRDRARIATTDLLNRARSVPLGGSQAHTLDAVDSLLHVCVHAARSGGHRLVWLKDIQQLWLRDRPDPAVLRERAQQWGVELALAIMLTRAQRALGDAELGQDVLELLSTGRAWRRMFDIVDVFAPVDRAGDGSSLTRLVSRAVAADPPHAAREGARRAASGLRHLQDHSLPAKTWDSTNPESVVFDSGGAAQRTAYFEAVAALP